VVVLENKIGRILAMAGRFSYPLSLYCGPALRHHHRPSAAITCSAALAPVR
jgi:hypothetical protein